MKSRFLVAYRSNHTGVDPVFGLYSTTISSVLRVDLASRAPRHGEGLWERTAGVGQIDIKAPGGAHVRGTVQEPHPGRTFYTLPWSEPGFADLEATISHPERGVEKITVVDAVSFSGRTTTTIFRSLSF